MHRLGGDEYVAVLPGVSPDEAGVMRERVRAVVDATVPCERPQKSSAAGPAARTNLTP